MNGQGKRNRWLVTIVSAILMLVLVLIYTVVTIAIKQDSKWSTRIDNFNQYYDDFDSIRQVVENLREEEQVDLYLALDKYRPLLYLEDQAVTMTSVETSSLQRIQQLFAEKAGFLGDIIATADQVVFKNINGKYGILYTKADVLKADSEKGILMIGKIRPHWYHVAYA